MLWGQNYLLTGKPTSSVAGPRILAAEADFTARGSPLVAIGVPADLLCSFPTGGRQSSLGTRRSHAPEQLSQPNPCGPSRNVFRDDIQRPRNVGQFGLVGKAHVIDEDGDSALRRCIRRLVQPEEEEGAGLRKVARDLELGRDSTLR